MKNKSTLKSIYLGFFTAALFVGFFVWLTYRNMQNSEIESRNVKSALEVLLHLENIVGDIQDIETGQRGFVISGDEKFLGSYNTGLQSLRKDTAILNSIVLTDSTKQSEREVLVGLINQKVQHSKYVVELRKIYGQDSAAAYLQEGGGIVLMNKINDLVIQLENKDRVLLRESNINRDYLAKRRTLEFLLMALIFYIVLFINFAVIRKDFKVQHKNQNLLKFNASLIKNISDAVVTTDNNLIITNWNDHAKRIYGYLESEVLGMNMIELFKTEYIGNSLQDVKDIYNKNDHWKGEMIHYNKNNEALFVEAAVSSIKNVEGKNIGTVSVIRDITERKTIENKLKQLTTNLAEEVKIKAAELNYVYERITDAFIALDNNWCYTYINTRAAEMHGVTPEELMGKNIWEVFPDVTDEPFFTALKEARETQKSLRVQLYYSKTDRWFEDLIYPSADGMSVYYHDITERKKAELALEASEQDLKISNERFMLVAKATNDAVWDWDFSTNAIWGNESFCKIFGIDDDNGLKFDDFTSRVHPDQREGILKNLTKTLKEKGTYLTEEFQLKMPDGNYRTFYDRAYLLYDTNGRAFRMLGAMQDITEQKSAQLHLLLEKELSDSIINSLPGIFYLFNSEGKYKRWNKNFEEVTGYSSYEISTMHPLNFFDDDEKELLSKKIENVFLVGHDNVEASFLLKNKEKIPFYFNGMVIKYEGELCLMGVGIDISEKTKAQKKLKDSEERYRTLIEQASDGIFISNEHGDYLDVNTSATILTGYQKEELLKLNIKDLMHETNLDTGPIMLDELKTGQVIISERVMKKKDGSALDVEISAKILPDGRFQGIVRNITARKLAEEELRISEHKYRLLFYQNPMPMWMISIPQRNFLDVNDAAIEYYGYSKKEFLSMNLRDINHAEEFKKSDGPLSAYRPGINNTGIWEHVKKDGTIIKVNVITHDIIYEGKHAKLVLANDLTEKIIAEEKLKKSHEELRQLATHIQDIREDERTRMAREIHDELGQQLTGLKMDVSWMSKKIPNSEPEIKQKMAETLVLIDGTVTSVRRIATQLRPSILDDLGLVAAMEWQSEEFQKRSEIDAKFKTNLGDIEISPEIATGLFRIFQESLTNVLRHSNATAINTSLYLTNGQLILNITDNGVGFNADEIENKKTLGLLGMKERTLMMGGTYEINSKAGEGATVTIKVPL